jgi:hypothetical protein
MSGALEAVDADGVDAELLGLERVPHAGAFVDNPHTGGLEHLDMLGRYVARGFDDGDT